MAYQFNGTNQRLSCASAPVTAIPLTLACWFYQTTVAAGGLVSLHDAQGSSNNFILMIDGTSLFAYAQNSGGPVAGISATSSPQNSTWHHGCAVFTSSTSRTVYLDGGNEATNTTSRTPLGINRLSVGALWFGSFSNFLNGIVGEVGVWNVALTKPEIASLAKGITCNKVRPQNLSFYAPLIRNLQDRREGLTITNNNGATVANQPRVYA